MHRSRAVGNFVQNLQQSRRSGFLLTCLTLVILLGMIGTQPLHAAVPGRYLYVVDQAVAQVEGFSVNLTNGVLVSLAACANFPIGKVPVSESVDPTGSYLYIADSGGNQVFGFNINPFTGCLVPIPGSPWATVGLAPHAIHATADGKYVFLNDSNLGAASVEGFQILPGGVLVPVPGTPFAYGVNPGGVAVDSVGPYLFAADDSAPAGPITALEYNPLAGGTPFPAPGCPGPCATVTPNPNALSVSATGQYLLVLSAGGITLDSYNINPTTGAVLWVNTLAIPAGGHAVFSDHFGRYSFVTNSVPGTVQPYTVTPPGVIAANGGKVVLPAGSAPAELVVDPWGKFLYISLPGTNQIAGFTINATTGKLAKIAGSPWAIFVPLGGPTAIHGITP